MLKNPPLSKLDFVVKTYMERQPWVVWDTIGIVMPALGIDDPNKDLQGSLLWRTPASTAKVVLNKSFSSDGHLFPALLSPRQRHLSAAQLREAQSTKELVVALKFMLHIMTDDRGFAGGVMRLKSDVDKLIPWVAREMSRQANAIFNLDSADVGAVDRAEERREHVYDQLARRLSLIAQWAKKNGVDIMKMSAEEVLQASADFVAKGAVERGEVVLRFESGWTAQRLTTPKALKDEGKAMSHCVGTYCEAVANEESVIYSIRDPDDVPYVTIEVGGAMTRRRSTGELKLDTQREGLVIQIYGHGNSDIGSEEFISYVLQKGKQNDPPLEHEEVYDVTLAIAQMTLQTIRSLPIVDASAVIQLTFYIAEYEDHEQETKRDLMAKKHGQPPERQWLAFNLQPGLDFVSDYYGFEPDSDQFRSIDLSNTKTANVNFAGLDLSGMSFAGADIQYTDFTGTLLFGTDFRVAKMNDNTRLSNAEFDSSTQFPETVENVRAGDSSGALFLFDPLALGMIDGDRWSR
jgi:hypothetical protein